MSRHRFVLLILLCCFLTGSAQTSLNDIEQLINDFFNQYACEVQLKKTSLKQVDLDKKRKTLIINVDETFSEQPFTPKVVDNIYQQIQSRLPRCIAGYDIKVMTGNQLIDDLIPNAYRKKNKDKTRMHPKGMNVLRHPWVSNQSKPYVAKEGLTEKHIAVGQSHGSYYSTKTDKWVWQRPNLFCTNEDLFTQSFIVPYLIPMLENAGAYVVTPRERDVQNNEIIVDNDLSSGSLYIEENSRKAHWQTASTKGFAQVARYLRDGENPFMMGTARYINTEKKKDKAFAQWIPDIRIAGSYAVYVSYPSLPNSVTDAKYIVFHKGGMTEFVVNQQIGGGTWVYLGTFDFDKGRDITGMVILSNQSKEKGVIGADAIRLGGGTGNIMRGNMVSGLPRYLEGARYTAQWYGMPYSVYGGRNGENDYADDINSRSLMINHLSGGSRFNPQEKGLGVPIEMFLSLHTDAGHKSNDAIVGTLGIYTSEFNNGMLANGTDRFASRDLSDLLMTQLQGDIQNSYQTTWTRRAMRNANYSETRLPTVASTIIELLSHQNFADMKWGHDPNFKFTASRALYKGILKYINQQYNVTYTVQPLPVSNISVRFGKKKNTVELEWIGEDDPLEPTAAPQEYIVYTRINDGGFDNGVKVKSPRYKMNIKPDVIYSFKVTAVNRGGESFPSEILSAHQSSSEKGTILIVNGFDRVSGPAVINNANEAGFDLNSDPGVPYLYTTAFVGAQQIFDRRQGGKEGKGSLGYSEDELVGLKIAGNSFDYPFVHGQAIKAAGNYSFVSCSDEAVENGLVSLNDFEAVDLILGLEKEDRNNSKYYKTFTPRMQVQLQNYCAQGGSLLISGSYLGSDMSISQSDRNFTQNILKYDFQSSLLNTEVIGVNGIGNTLKLSQKPNESYYTLTAPEALQPTNGGFATMVYESDQRCAAVAYNGNYRTFVMGFPFENIDSGNERARIMASVLHFFQIK